MSRLSSGGLINRNAPVSFHFDDREFNGFEGDTLASALLANDVRLMGRSFKYHRPRGVLTAGSEEPNALVQIGLGDQTTPNVRATVQEIYEGLEATSQNRFPSLKYDFMAVTDMLSPFLSAGFYYKTFMWPAAFWEKLYEPIIRRAAGLGRLSGKPDTDIHDRAFTHCDLLVIGAGPAGLMAALTAGRAGARVILADEDFLPGGRLNSEATPVGGQSGSDWAADVVVELCSLSNVTVMTRTTVTGAYDGGTYGALERVSEHLDAVPEHAPKTTFWRIAAKRAILAGGALERGIAFADNDRPGVMMAGAVRTYLNRYAVAPGQKLTVFTNNDDGHRTARDAMAAGVDVAAVVDTRTDAPGGDYEVLAGSRVLKTTGRLGLEEIWVPSAGSPRRIAADCLAVSGGWNPSVHLTCHLGGRPEWRKDVAAFVPKAGSVPDLTCAGAVTGAFSTAEALQQGQAEALAVLERLGLKGKKAKLPEAEDAPVNITPFWHVTGTGRAWLDFQNDVTVKDIKQAYAENFRSVEHMKRYTTLGMATDQGKNANMGALAVMAEMTGQTIPETGTTTFRPPYTPVPLASLGARSAGKDYAPQRFIPSDDFSRKKKAHMVEAGLWYRPSFFRRKGEFKWRLSCDREVRMVREAVGVCDVTTLGKIDVQGPDAAKFLDLVYTNMMSALKLGRVRYGLMLREDGHVMDDGTAARFSEDHYVITTTTAAAGQVMSHLEFAHQCLWPELNVAMISVTDQWGQFAVAGPKSRALLQEICDEDIADEAFPYMSHGAVTVGGIKGRLFRISFSGEHAYEIALPARYGAALMAHLTKRAEAMDGGAYGLEALNVMRIEKGFITHAEIHGRVTAADIGMQALVSDKKDCIGKVASQRPGLHGPDRQQLVGLRPKGVSQQILAGAHLMNEGEAPTPGNDQGYVTSSCYSPTENSVLALGFLVNGRARYGERLRAVDPLRDIETIVEVCPPVFHDPKGEKLRG